MPKQNCISIGNAGEYFVAGELERHGFTVALPMSKVKDFDILAVSRQNNNSQFCIQVKTTSYSKKEWTLSSKNEKLIGDNIVYVFVTLNKLGTPEYHVVPSKVVAQQISETHRRWLQSPGKKGQKHNDNPVRKFSDADNIWLDRWDVLTEVNQ